MTEELEGNKETKFNLRAHALMALRHLAAI
jgi:hypothetical protein